MSLAAHGKSPPPFEVTIRGGVVHAAIHGRIDFPASAAVLAEAIARASSAGTRKLLFDITDAELLDFHTIVLRHADGGTRFAEMGLRIAVVGRQGDRVLDFIQDVAVNRAFPTRTFHDEAAALAWLG